MSAIVFAAPWCPLPSGDSWASDITLHRMSTVMHSAPLSLQNRMPWSSRNVLAGMIFFWWSLSFKCRDVRFPALSVTTASLQNTLSIGQKYTSYTTNSHTSCFHSSAPMIWSSMILMLMVAAGVAQTEWWIMLNASATRLAAAGKYLIEQCICCSLSKCRHWQLQSFC